MKPKLAALQAMFPHISMSVLQERLAAAQGHLPNAVKVVCLTMKALWPTWQFCLRLYTSMSHLRVKLAEDSLEASCCKCAHLNLLLSHTVTYNMLCILQAQVCSLLYAASH